MKYKKRPGIVLVKICDKSLLIPTRAAFPACNHVRTLPVLWAITWDLFDQEGGEEKIMRLHQILTKRSPEENRARLDLFCQELCKQGYMIEVPEEEQNDNSELSPDPSPEAPHETP